MQACVHASVSVNVHACVCDAYDHAWILSSPKSLANFKVFLFQGLCSLHRSQNSLFEGWQHIPDSYSS